MSCPHRASPLPGTMGRMKILMVLTSHDTLGDTGERDRVLARGVRRPYFRFTDAGADIVVASPAGGQPPLDPKSDQPDAQTDDTRRFEADEDAKARLAETVTLESVNVGDFDAVFYPAATVRSGISPRIATRSASSRTRSPPTPRSVSSATRQASCGTSPVPTANRW